jgi:predicted SprT family Zn-dependent metalloprotease
MNTDYELAVFKKFVPEAAAAYCHKLYSENNFEFRIVDQRESKQGDFRYDPELKKHVISVNNNLNSYSFLITYIHEVAHYTTYQKYKNRVKPHGEEWKSQFRVLLGPLIRNHIFPRELEWALMRHLKNPKAATCSDPKLYILLSRYNKKTESQYLLSQLKTGEMFMFKNRIFKKEGKRRTRAVCFELKSGKRYLIPEIAEVSNVPTHQA